MDDDVRELMRQLFAAATGLIETAHNAAVAGQSGAIAAGEYAETACRLDATARDIAVIAKAATIVANMGIDQHANGLKPSR